MLTIRPRDIRRVAFAKNLFPRLKSALGLSTDKLKTISDEYDGEVFAGGRSVNKHLLKFFGFIGDSTVGFVQLPAFRRSLKKLIALVEHELELVGAQEVLLPTLVPQRLWHKSSRLERQPNAFQNVYNFQDPAGRGLLMGPTFEESITQFMASIDGSIAESELPIRLYQSSPKFRFEPNPRFGLIRSNEFFMNDLYTFDKSLETATETYNVISSCYDRIFKKLKLNCLRTQNDPGSIGGKYSHEYQLPLPSGEDTIIECGRCHEIFNQELLASKDNKPCTNCNSESNCLRPMKCLELGHTFLLSDTYSKPLNACFTQLDHSRSPMEMGCYGLGLTRIIGAGVDLLSIVPKKGVDSGQLQIRWPSHIEPFKVGIVAPAKRSKQFHAGSTEFIQRIVDNLLSMEPRDDIDILVEDRDKESLVKRILLLKSLGLPNIIVIGQRFLLDKPEVEFLSLDEDKKDYVQAWFTEEQLYDYVKTNIVDNID